MAKSTRKKTNNPNGRPKTTGPGKPMVVRMHTPQVRRLDRWIKQQVDRDIITRPEAIRRLVDRMLDRVLRAA